MSVETKTLVADIGGTNIRLGLAGNVDLSITDIRQYKVGDYPGLVETAKQYLIDVSTPVINRAAIAVATPVDRDRVKLTNSHWDFSIAQSCAALGLQRIKVINDFTSLALSLPGLERSNLIKIGGSEPAAHSAMALIGPGTGLGVSGLLPHGDHWIPLEGEGGHVTVGATNARELAIFSALRERFRHVSAERLLSGTGFPDLHQAIAQLDGKPAELKQPADITRLGISGECPVCAEVLALFCRWLGIVAGNLAITMGARGGVYLGGGIVPKLGEYFLSSDFRSSFNQRGRFSEYLAAIPVYIINGGQPALAGAARSLDDLYMNIGINHFSSDP